MMREYRQHFDQLRFGEILNRAGITIEGLPKLPEFTRSGRSTLCYNYICGKCGLHQCNFDHIPGSKLTEDFVQKFIGMVKSGIQRYIEAHSGNHFDRLQDQRNVRQRRDYDQRSENQRRFGYGGGGYGQGGGGHRRA